MLGTSGRLLDLDGDRDLLRSRQGLALRAGVLQRDPLYVASDVITLTAFFGLGRDHQGRDGEWMIGISGAVSALMIRCGCSVLGYGIGRVIRSDGVKEAWVIRWNRRHSMWTDPRVGGSVGRVRWRRRRAILSIPG